MSGAPYVSVNTLVPTQQRGMYNGVQTPKRFSHPRQSGGLPQALASSIDSRLIVTRLASRSVLELAVDLHVLCRELFWRPCGREKGSNRRAGLQP
eukprot:SAG11_NODE_1846_length_4172_cov_3.188313_6_plen_95_part_00